MPQEMSARSVVRDAIAAKTAATAATSAAAAKNGSGAPFTPPCAGPNAPPPTAMPARVVTAVYGRYGQIGWYRPPATDSTINAQMSTPTTAASWDLINAPTHTPMA